MTSMKQVVVGKNYKRRAAIKLENGSRFLCFSSLKFFRPSEMKLSLITCLKIVLVLVHLSVACMEGPQDSMTYSKHL